MTLNVSVKICKHVIDVRHLFVFPYDCVLNFLLFSLSYAGWIWFRNWWRYMRRFVSLALFSTPWLWLTGVIAYVSRIYNLPIRSVCGGCSPRFAYANTEHNVSKFGTPVTFRNCFLWCFISLWKKNQLAMAYWRYFHYRLSMLQFWFGMGWSIGICKCFFCLKYFYSNAGHPCYTCYEHNHPRYLSWLFRRLLYYGIPFSSVHWFCDKNYRQSHCSITCPEIDEVM